MLAEVGDAAVVDGLIAPARERFGRLDIHINNAAVRPAQSLEQMTLSAWHAVLAVNLDGAFSPAKSALAPLRARGAGATINIGGVSGHAGAEQRAHVVTAKAGLVKFLKWQAAAGPHADPAHRAEASACSRSLRSRRGTRGGRCGLVAGPRASPAASAKLAVAKGPASALGNVSAAVAWATERRATARRARVGAVGMTASAIRLWLREPDTREALLWRATAAGPDDQKGVPCA